MENLLLDDKLLAAFGVQLAGNERESSAGNGQSTLTDGSGVSANAKLFESVRYYPSGELDPRVEKLLEAGGATRSRYLLGQETHIICGDDYSEVEVLEGYDIYQLPVLQQHWVFVCASVGHLVPTQGYEIGQTKLFSDIVAYLYNLCDADLVTLTATITFYGGKVQNNFDKSVNLFVCGVPDGDHYKFASNLTSDTIKLVTPDWINSCIEVNSLVDHTAYHPRFLNADKQAALLNHQQKQQKQQQHHLYQQQSMAVSTMNQTDMNDSSMKILSSTPSTPVTAIMTSSSLDLISSLVTSDGISSISNVPTTMTAAYDTKVNLEMDLNQTKHDLSQAIGNKSQMQQKKQLQQQQQQQQQAQQNIIQQQQQVTLQQAVQQPQQILNIQSQATGNQQQIFQAQQQVQNPGQQQQVQQINANGNGKQQIQFMTGAPHAGNVQQQHQIKMIQSMPVQQAQGVVKSGQIQGQPTQRIVINQQQFNQLNQQQQIYQNAQNSGILIINQANPNQTAQLIKNQQPQSQIQHQQQSQQIGIQSHGIQQTGQIINQQGMQQQQIVNVTQSPQQQTIVQQQGHIYQNFNQQQPQQQQQQMAQIVQQPVQQRLQFVQQSPNQQQQITLTNQQQSQQQNVRPMLQQIKINQPQVQQQQNVASPQIITTVTNIQNLPQESNATVVNQSQSGFQATHPQQQQQIIIQNSSQVQQMVSNNGQPTQQIIITNQHPQGASSQLPSEIIAVNKNGAQAQPGGTQIVQQGQQQTQPGQTQQQWIPTSPGNATNVQQVRPGMQGVVLRTICTPPGSQWPNSRIIRLDAQSHQAYQQMDPAQRAEYLKRLEAKRTAMGQMAYQQGGPRAAVAGVRPTQTVYVRSAMPAGLTQQQQIQWLQQQGGRNVVVRGAAPALCPLTNVSTNGNHQADGTVTFASSALPQQQMQQNIVLRQQQFQRIQKLGPDQNHPQSGATFADGTQTTEVINIPVTTQQPNQQVQENVTVQSVNTNQMNSKTKTALANMLNSRLGANGPAMGTQIQTETPAEPSAAGTLRFLTARHNATMGGQRMTQEILQHQQRRLSANGQIPASPRVIQGSQGQSSILVLPQATDQIKGNQFVAGRVALPPQPQFYGHNPNLKMPPNLFTFLIGCIFYIVEYDDSNMYEVNDWKELIRKHGGEVENFYCSRVTHVLCRTQRHGVVMQAIRDTKRCVTAYWLNDVMIKRQVIPPWQAIHLPMPSTFGTQRPATKHIITTSGFEGEEKARIKKMIEEVGAKLTGYFSRHNTVLICKRQEGEKYKKAKEWNIPVVNAIWLSDILLGNLSTMSQYETSKYQQYNNIQNPFRIDYALVPHLMNGWKSPINLTSESHQRLMQSLGNQPIGEPKAKRQCIRAPLEDITDEIVCNELPEQDKVPKIMFTQVENIDGLTKIVNTLGGVVVKEAFDATHLVLSRLVRTVKLLNALCTVKYVLTSRWLTDSAKIGKFLPTDEYYMDDDKFNELYKCDIQKTLSSMNRHQLMEGKSFYITPGVIPCRNDLTKLIELCGGKVDKTRRSSQYISEQNSEKPTYIIITCTNDYHLLQEVVKSNRPNRILCTSELILDGILTQNLNIDAHMINL